MAEEKTKLTEENNSFIHQMLSGANGHWSSKRIIGCICFLYYLVLVAYLIISKTDPNEKSVELLKIVPYCGAALLGIGTFEKKVE